MSHSRRWFSFSRLGVLLFILVSVGCNDVEKSLDDFARKATKQAIEDFRTTPPKPDTGQTVSRPVPPTAAGDTVTIASFNIQVFGSSKMAKPEVMDVLARVVRRFDVVAIQEVRAKDQTVVPRFVEMVNASGGHYRHVLGPRLGRTSSKEQYAILYDAARIELQPGSVYTVSDPQDQLHREPLVARFRVRGPAAEEAFTFSLVDIHTDPDETDWELDALADVFTSVQRNGSGEDDVILLGDLNVDEYHLGRLGQLPAIVHAIKGITTNTRGTKSYDNLVFDGRATQEYTGRFGVVNLMADYQLTKDQAIDVSDHLPVWAEFTAREAGSGARIATRPEPGTPAGNR